jgi:hypothetical protein
MKRPSDLRAAPREWVQVLQKVYPFLTSRGIGDLVLYGSQAASVYVKTPLRSKDLDLVSLQIGPEHFESLVEELQKTKGFGYRSSQIQSRPLDKALLKTYSIELRVSGKPFFVEILDKVLNGQDPTVLTPYVDKVRRWGLDLWVPSPNAVVALRLCFRQPEGISTLNAARLNSFIKQNRPRISLRQVNKMIEQWGMQELVRQNLTMLHKIHRQVIRGEEELSMRARDPNENRVSNKTTHT